MMLRTAYAASTNASRGAIEAPRISDAVTSAEPSTIPEVLLTRPAAIGRLRLVGCARSALRSATSFQQYMPLAIRQKHTNAPNAWSLAELFVASPEKRRGASTN